MKTTTSVTLRDGGAITVRALAAGDEEALLDFFLNIPEEDKFFLRDDVTSIDVVKAWTRKPDHSRAIPLVATDAHSIIGEGVVIRRQGAARQHVAEIRLSVAPTWRKRGVGTVLIRSLCDVASNAGFSAVLFELVEDGQSGAVQAAEEMGFVTVGRLEGGARDPGGNLHDLITLAMPLDNERP
ncbi:MAG: GNAT family N-acetyltransferase [Chloroflexota bacterium]